MTNVYFSKEGITSTQANYLANMAKEFQNAAAERLNNLKFYQTSVAVIGSSDKQLSSTGTSDISFISEDLNLSAAMNAFCAWIREAIKEKDNQLSQVERLSIEAWAYQQGISMPVAPTTLRDPEPVTKEMVMDTWDLDKRNRYFRLEAYAATFGKFVHLEGAYNKARKTAHKIVTNPITVEGTGRDTVLKFHELTVDIKQIDSTFMELQNIQRKYEQELNCMKAELNETVNKLTNELWAQFKVDCDTYKALYNEYQIALAELRAQYNTWRTNEIERISQLKIAIPEILKPAFQILKEMGNTSK